MCTYHLCSVTMDVFRQPYVCTLLLILQAVVFHFDCITASVPTEVQLLLQSSPLPNRDGDYKAAAIHLQGLAASRGKPWTGGQLLYQRSLSRSYRRARKRKRPGKPAPGYQRTMTINYTIEEEHGRSQVRVRFGPVDKDLPYHTVCLSPNITHGSWCIQKVNVTQPDAEIPVYKMTFHNVPRDCYNIMILPAKSDTWFYKGPLCVTAKPPTVAPPSGLSQTAIIVITLSSIAVVATATTLAFCAVWKRMDAGQALFPRFIKVWKRIPAAQPFAPNNGIQGEPPAADGPENKLGNLDDQMDDADQHDQIPNGTVIPMADRIENAQQWASHCPPEGDACHNGWPDTGPNYQPLRQQQPEPIIGRAICIVCNGRNGCKCHQMERNDNVCQRKPQAVPQNGSRLLYQENVYLPSGKGRLVQYLDSGFSEPIEKMEAYNANGHVFNKSHVKDIKNAGHDEFFPPESDSESDSQSMLNQKFARINKHYMNHTPCLTHNEIDPAQCGEATQEEV